MPHTAAASEPVESSAQSEPPVMTSDRDKDSLHILPLSSIPLKTPGMQKWQLTKNARLDTVVEIYNVAKKASAQVAVDELHKYFDDRAHALGDLIILRKLAALNSFDVYSLRIQLRRHKIPVTDQAELQLSEAKKQELVQFMRNFTRPLIQRVYGSGEHTITDFDQLVSMFSNPDRGEALKNLQILADTMQVGLVGIPNFLEEYGDVFLSMAYYRSIFAEIGPGLSTLSDWVRKVAKSYQFREDQTFQRACTHLIDTLARIRQAIGAVLIGFEANAKRFWDDLSMTSFHTLREQVSRQHELIGGLLCGLDVKLRIWREQFESRRTGPEAGAGFILSDMIPGLEKLLGLAEPQAKEPVKKPRVILTAAPAAAAP